MSTKEMVLHELGWSEPTIRKLLNHEYFQNMNDNFSRLPELYALPEEETIEVYSTELLFIKNEPASPSNIHAQ